LYAQNNNSVALSLHLLNSLVQKVQRRPKCWSCQNGKYVGWFSGRIVQRFQSKKAAIAKRV